MPKIYDMLLNLIYPKVGNLAEKAVLKNIICYRAASCFEKRVPQEVDMSAIEIADLNEKVLFNKNVSNLFSACKTCDDLKYFLKHNENRGIYIFLAHQALDLSYFPLKEKMLLHHQQDTSSDVSRHENEKEVLVDYAQKSLIFISMENLKNFFDRKPVKNELSDSDPSLPKIVSLNDIETPGYFKKICKADFVV